MNLDKVITQIKTEEPSSLEKLIFLFSVESSDILYSPTQNNEFNIKHRLECIICSTMEHLWIVNTYYPQTFNKVGGGVMRELTNLMFFDFDSIKDFSDLGFVDLPKRFGFYGEEFGKLKNLNSTLTLPWKLLSLVYEKPLIKDIDSFKKEKDEIDFLNKMPQFINVSIHLKHIKEPLLDVLKNADKLYRYGHEHLE